MLNFFALAVSLVRPVRACAACHIEVQPLGTCADCGKCLCQRCQFDCPECEPSAQAVRCLTCAREHEDLPHSHADDAAEMWRGMGVA